MPLLILIKSPTTSLSLLISIVIPDLLTFKLVWWAEPILLLMIYCLLWTKPACTDTESRMAIKTMPSC